MKALFITLVCCIGIWKAGAQQFTVSGNIRDGKGEPLSFASVALLEPADSTLSYFGVTDESGAFVIKAVNKGGYLLQVAIVGFNTYYRKVQLPGNAALGDIILKEKGNVLKEVQVSGEKIPFLVKKDTIEYNAGAYKVKPDASVEDLLKKLPGVQVDKAGNVKANGKDVQKVLVDGKEFFGDDPKVATKNLPSDAIDKVQVFDKRSDQSLFTGIDDGERDRTINLLLKGNKKSGYFGDVQAGYGTGDHFKLNGKVYRFTKKTQFAALGMLNNINQFGFTLDDYISFRGGLRSLMDGNGNVSLRITNNVPINFGQPEPGFITSAAAGLNYTYEWSKDNRLNISYLGNGADRKLDQQTTTQNFTGNGSFVVNDQANETSRDHTHRFNLNWRNKIDSSIQLTANGNADLSYSKTNRDRLAHSTLNDIVLNDLDGRLYDKGQGISAGGRLSLVKKNKTKWPVYRLYGDVNYEKDLSNTQWNNLVTYLPAPPVRDQQYQENNMEYMAYSAGAAVVRSIGKGYYLEGDISGGIDKDALNRKQGLLSEMPLPTDSVSGNFTRSYTFARPALTIRKSSDKIQFNTGLKYEAGSMDAIMTTNYQYLLPSAFWQNQYQQGKEVNVLYNTQVNLPRARQMFPVADRSNPLYIVRGNISLKPEYQHTLAANWHSFDAFDMTTFFLNANFRYTNNKIVLARTIDPGLAQSATYVNVTDDYAVDGRTEYSRPVRKLGITATVGFNEHYNRGIAPVNNQQNINNTFTHEFICSFTNRKKDKVEVEIGGSAAMSNTRYSIDKALNNTYYKYSGTAKISYRPVSYWYFMAGADVNYYDGQSFSQSVTIPLLNAEVSYYFLKFKRGVLTLEAFDLLNRNTDVQRVSQLNYLQETRSNIIGRYAMLSFKYRLSMVGAEPKIRIK